MNDKEKQAILVMFDKKHLRHAMKRKKVLDLIFDSLSKEAARIGKASGFDDPEAEFHFEDYPQTQRLINQLLAEKAKDIADNISNGNVEEWMLSEAKNRALITGLAKSTKIDKATIAKWTKPNTDALAAFQERKVNGMGLSDRVWKITEQTKAELELALDIGLGEGKSAAALSRDVRQYLNEPKKLFRRVRDKHGNLRLSKAAQAYHPGQGVYRSSYKNALRMTGTENNIAYRTADHEKWGELDFVIGQEVHLSNNHTCKGVKGIFVDICDKMQGKYPKAFKFTGWHPHCRCFVTPLLADWEEQLKVMDMRMNGEDVSNYHYKGEITDVPEGYKQWMKDNADRIARAKSMPYFIKDNPEYAAQASGVDIEAKKGKQEAIKDAGAHKYGGGVKNKEVILDEDSVLDVLFKEDVNHPTHLSEDIANNNTEVATALGVSAPRKMMQHHVANCGNVNPDMNFVGGKDNCAICSFTYELRRRGFNVKANLLNPTDKTSKAWIAGEDYKELWTHIEHTTAKAEKGKTIIESLNNETKHVGRYHLEWDWNTEKGHHIVALRLSNKQLVLYDSQLRLYYDAETYFRNIKEIGVYRVDNATVNTEKIKDLVKKVSFKK